MVEHSTLTTTDLHEPKGAAGANVDEIYVADGVGSGAWKVRGAHGEMHQGGNAVATTIASSATYVQVVNFANYHSDGVTSASNGMTTLTDGHYILTASISFTGATGDIFKFDISRDCIMC